MTRSVRNGSLLVGALLLAPVGAMLLLRAVVAGAADAGPWRSGDASGFVGLAALCFVASGSLFLLAARRQRTFGAGHCPSCGYDLRGSPGDCPECGATR